MRIAVIGWGSILWYPGDLTLLTRRWRKDGPALPIEFARRSRKGRRLTLAIAPEHENLVRTYWAISSEGRLSDARENLRVREDTSDLTNIFTIEKGGAYSGRDRNLDVRNAVLDWLQRQEELDAAIWTGLKANWPKDEKLNLDNVEKYIGSQNPLDRAGIKNYVRRAPAQTNTPIRRGLEEKLGWARIPLSASCLEDGAAET